MHSDILAKENHVDLKLPLPWASVHWNASGWPSVHWDTTGRPSGHLQGTLEHPCKNLVETAPHWNATVETLTIFTYTETPLEKK